MTWQWILGFHIIGIVMWIGGLMSLTRLLGQRARDPGENVELAAFEKKSYFAGILPGMILVIVTGSLMLSFKGGSGGFYFDPKGAWGATFHVKMLLITIMIAVSEIAMWKMRQFQKGKLVSRSVFMGLHGVSALLLMVVILLVKTNFFGPA